MKNSLLLFLLINLVTVSTAFPQEQDKSNNELLADEIIVSSSAIQETVFSSAQSTSVIKKEQLDSKNTSSLGAALQDELGVTATSFGAGASRPIIRGLGGDRIRILQNGTGTNDVSNTSPDHPVNVDLLNADSVEILRGPSALRFGTTAIGGAVNVLDNRIPELMPEGILEGDIVLRGGTNDLERAAGFRATTKVSENIAVHLESSNRKSNDYRIKKPSGRLDSSNTQTNNVSLGTSYIKDESFLGFAASYLDSDYGVPTDDEQIEIGMRQPKLDIRGKLADPTEFLRSISINSTMSDYKHIEYEDGQTGTIFRNRGSDTRLEFDHQPISDLLKGTFGTQVQTSRFKAIGDEAYLAPSATDIVSFYLIEEMPVIKEQLSFQAGLRTDHQSTDVTGYSSPFDENISDQNLSRNFNTFSQSAGIVYNPVKNYSLGLSVAHTERAPVAQELFANGPHLATTAFELGNPDLKTEKSVGVDLTLRKKEGLVSGSVGGFMNRFSNYIGLNPTEDEEDDLPVYLFESQKAQFYGVESMIGLHLFGQTLNARQSDDLTLFVQQDWVWAKDTDTNEPIARTPPYRIKAGIQFKKESLGARLEVMRVNTQDRVAQDETSTSGYTFLNAGVTKDINIWSYDFPAQLFVRGENLTNQDARNHVSFIKDTAPLMGRNVMAGIRVNF